MRNKFLGILGLIGFCFILTGCNAVQGYSVRSYQGPLPMKDYQFLNSDAGATTTASR